MDEQVKKVFNGDIFAIDGDRTEIESKNEDYPIVRENGLGSEYSTIAVLPRKIFNQIFCENYAAAKECLRGIPRYDSSINYPADSFVSVNGAIYHTDQATTGVTPNPNNSTVWSLIGDRSVPPASKPSKILASNIFIDGSRSNQFKVYWTNSSDGGRPITQAKIRYSKSATFSSGVKTINSYSQGTIVSVPDNDSDLYFIRVSVQNSVGWSEESDSKDVLASPLTPPPLTHFSITSGNTSGRIDLSWNPVVPQNGLTIASYTVEYKTGSQNFGNASTITGTSVTLAGLVDGTSYTFRIKVNSNRGTQAVGVFTASATPSSGSSAPSKPTINANGGFRSISAAASGIPDNNGSAITSYDWQYKKSTDSGWTSGTSTTAPIFSVNGLSAGTFSIQMRAVNGSGDGPWSDSASVAVTSYSSPSGVVAVVKSGGSGKAVCSIGGDVNDGGSSITGFQWQYKLNDASDWTDVTSSTNPTQVISGLTVDSTYEFRIKATNLAGTTTSGIVSLEISSGTKGPPKDLYFPGTISRSTRIGTTNVKSRGFYVPLNFLSNGSVVTEVKWYLQRKRNNVKSDWVNVDLIGRRINNENNHNFIVSQQKGWLYVKSISYWGHGLLYTPYDEFGEIGDVMNVRYQLINSSGSSYSPSIVGYTVTGN